MSTTQPTSVSSPSSKVWRIARLGFLILLTGSLITSCVERLKSSDGFTCTKKSDCWDNLPCLNEVCTGEKPSEDPEPGPEPVGPEPRLEPPTKPDISGESTIQDGSEQPQADSPPTERVTPEPKPEPKPEPSGPCKGNVNSLGLCKKDSDCCSGQKCIAIPDPRVPKGSKACSSCKTDNDCPQKTVCCTQFKLCAARCQ